LSVPQKGKICQSALLAPTFAGEPKTGVRASRCIMMRLPDDVLGLVLYNAITRSPWPGGCRAMFRLVSRRAHGIFLDVARDLLCSLGWLLKRSLGRTLNHKVKRSATS
jgi:hypothetical protein